MLEAKGNAPIEDVVTPRLKEALRVAMENEINRRESGDISTEDHHELMFSLSQALIALKDPEVLSLIMNVAHKGKAAQHGLLTFGPDIIPMLVEYYDSGGPATVAQITGTLDMFRAAYNEWGSFDEQTIAVVKALVIENLTLPEGYVYDPEVSKTNRWAALNLAGRLGDDELKPYVEALVEVEQEFVDRHELPYRIVFENGFTHFSNPAWHALMHWGERQSPEAPSAIKEVVQEPEKDH